jgi:hypothetical protein
LASGLAGAKAGILGGIFFAAAAGLFNIALLEAFRGSVLATFQTVAICTTAPTTPQDCFSTLLTADIPSLVMFPIAVLGILFGALYGMYFEYIPGRGYPIKAVGMGLVMLILMVLSDLAGNTTTTDQMQLITMRVFDVLAMLGYALIIAHFYRKFTREVKFESPNPRKLKITVDRKNYTGKLKTLSLHSTHTVRAPSESSAFHEWLVSGGVSVLDSKSFETTMRVDGDGLLKIS